MSCVRCWCRERCTQSFKLHFISGLLNFPSPQNFSIFHFSRLQLFTHLTFIFWKACNARDIMHLLKIHFSHPNFDSFSLNIISRSKSARVCMESLEVGLAFAGTIRHLSVLSISGGASQFLPPISFEAQLSKVSFKSGTVRLPGKIPT